MEIKKLRREIKQSISNSDYRIIRQALMDVCQNRMNPSSMQTERMHSLFFEYSDGMENQKEKNSEKFVLRYSNEDKTAIRLEKKSRRKDFLLERSACISRRDCERIIAGDIEFLNGSEDPLLF